MSLRKTNNELDIENGSGSNHDQHGNNRNHDTSLTPTAAPTTNSPYAVLKAVYALGLHKAHESWGVLFMQAFQAGMYKSFACQLYLTVGGGLVGGLLFPISLIAILLTGAELFTSDSLFVVITYWAGKIKLRSAMRNLIFSWVFNFCGALFGAVFLTYFSGQMEVAKQVDFAIYTAEKKALQPWHQIFLRGIGANYLIALAVWLFTTAQSVAGKIMAIYFPVVTFVLIGFDHCVANMYFIPLGMMYGANVTIFECLFMALLPATLGNVVGGALGMGFVYWYLHDDSARQAQLMNRLGDAMSERPSVAMVSLRALPGMSERPEVISERSSES